MVVEGGDNLNPDPDDKPSALPIRIIQLKDKQPFLSATEEELLSDDLRDNKSWVIAYQEEKVRKSLERAIEIEIQPEVRFLGVIGHFIEPGVWKAVLDVNELDSKKLIFNGWSCAAEPRDS